MEGDTSEIRLDNLSIGYRSKKGTKAVASGITATIRSGELTCLIGPNGAGKSTLLRTLAGFLPKAAGTASLRGRDIGSYKPRELARLVGIVLTEKPDTGCMTVAELVALGRSPYTGFWGTCSDADRRAAARAMADVGIGHLAGRRVATLSDGERQKAMVAKALAQQTPVILLDEPTAFLDFPSKVETMRLLRGIARHTGKVVFMSTHDLDLALQAADTLWLMARGGDRYFYHANHLGSTLALTDGSGQLLERVDYSPYGAPSFTDAAGNAIAASSVGNNILFTGREYDALTGTYYFRARTQHPALGRFMQKDPLMYVDGMNDYSYVGNRSVIYIDRWGLNAETCDSWSGPYISAAPSPIITAAPEKPDFIRTDNKPKSDFCKEHPYICGIQGEAHGEGCFFLLAGACIDGSVAVDKDGIHIGIGTTAGLGLAASASGGISSGYNLSGNNAGGSVDIRANVGVDAGLGYGLDYRYDGEQHKFSGTVGSVTASGSTDGSVSVGVDGGVGAGIFGGVHAGYTWSFKPWK